jgi:hypothetical protein
MQRHYQEATMLNWKIWKRYHKYIVCVLFVLLGACTSLPSPVDEKGLFKRSPSDTDLFNKGMSYLGNNEKVADYTGARSTFDELLKIYPDSKWRSISAVLIRLIDGMQSCKEKSSADRILIEKTRDDKSRFLRETEQLKEDNRNLLEETARLIQGNELLKKDIQLLKSLEVQLEKREKMLR